VYLPGLKTRFFLRLELDEPSAGAALRVQSFEFSRSIHAFWNNVANGEARGWHPRWLHNEQSVWTPFGTSSGIHCALMNEDGMVEVDQGSFSIEPMLWTPDRLFTWTDVTSRQELLEEWTPVPSVSWEAADWRLRMQAETTLSGVSRVRLSVRESHGSSAIRALVRAAASVSSHAAVAEFPQFGRASAGSTTWHGVMGRCASIRIS